MKHGDDLTAIMAEVQRKVQKSWAEDCLNHAIRMQLNQHRPLLDLEKKDLAPTAPDNLE
jgi:hypothetical protein